MKRKSNIKKFTKSKSKKKERILYQSPIKRNNKIHINKSISKEKDKIASDIKNNIKTLKMNISGNIIIQNEFHLNKVQNKDSFLHFGVNYQKEQKKVGLTNIGAPPYMNATLQCFAHIKEFIEFFKKDKSKINIISDKNTLSYSFKLLIDNLWEDDPKKFKSYFNPSEFRKKINKMNSAFTKIEANDAKRFINFIIMNLHEELNTENNNNIILSDKIPEQTNKLDMFADFSKYYQTNFNSLINKLFCGVNNIITQCTECQSQFFDYQVYYFKIFPLDEVKKFVSENHNNINRIGNEVDIYQCFEFDHRTCSMSGDNSIFCNKCQKRTNCNICTNLVLGPNILILLINRNKSMEFNAKLQFFEDLDLTNYSEFKNSGLYKYRYKLISVIIHLGYKINIGHYIAYCKDPYTFNWFKFNDSIVSPVYDLKKEVFDFGIPYLLFYQKE